MQANSMSLLMIFIALHCNRCYIKALTTITMAATRCRVDCFLLLAAVVAFVLPVYWLRKCERQHSGIKIEGDKVWCFGCMFMGICTAVLVCVCVCVCKCEFIFICCWLDAMQKWTGYIHILHMVIYNHFPFKGVSSFSTLLSLSLSLCLTLLFISSPQTLTNTLYCPQSSASFAFAAYFNFVVLVMFASASLLRRCDVFMAKWDWCRQFSSKY